VAIQFQYKVGGIVMSKSKKVIMKVVSFDGISGTGKSQIMRLLMGYFQNHKRKKGGWVFGKPYRS
jgi:ABC-type glutathione transport system ATPase component